MTSRRRFLATVGAGAVGATSGCTDAVTPDDDVPGPAYPPGTLWVYNTARTSLSVTVRTVDHSPAATFEETVPSGETAIRREFVSAPAGTPITLRARVETFAEDWLSVTFTPSGDGSGDTPPQYARFHVPGSDGEVTWQTREASD